MKSLSRVRLFETPWTAAHQAPPFMGFSRQECWSGVPSPKYKEFRKMVTMVLYLRQQKRHRCKELSFRLSGRRWGWDDLRIALKPVYYHMWNRSPVQVGCMRQGAQGWCTGMTQRDGMGREVLGGFRMGNTCTPMADSCQCMAKPLQYYKVTSLQLK